MKEISWGIFSLAIQDRYTRISGVRGLKYGLMLTVVYLIILSGKNLTFTKVWY